jgi:hypothetical protein
MGSHHGRGVRHGVVVDQLRAVLQLGTNNEGHDRPSCSQLREYPFTSGVPLGGAVRALCCGCCCIPDPQRHSAPNTHDTPSGGKTGHWRPPTQQPPHLHSSRQQQRSRAGAGDLPALAAPHPPGTAAWGPPCGGEGPHPRAHHGSRCEPRRRPKRPRRPVRSTPVPGPLAEGVGVEAFA